MTIWNSKDVEGKKVFAQHGREVGTVEALEVAIGTWKVEAFLVKLRREVLEELNLKRPLMGSQTIRLPTSHISGISDTVVLGSSIDQLALLA